MCVCARAPALAGMCVCMPVLFAVTERLFDSPLHFNTHFESNVWQSVLYSNGMVCMTSKSSGFVVLMCSD